MDKKVSMSRSERLRREKVTRYSIRKYSFGAASVAVAALFMFLGNGAVSADENGVDSQGGAAVAASPNGGGETPPGDGAASTNAENGQATAGNEASAASTDEPPVVDIPYSNTTEREIYVYGAEETSFEIKIKDDAGKIKRATLLQGGNNRFNSVAGETDKINTKYGYTANEFKNETSASDATPAVIRYSGTPAPDTGFTQTQLENATKGENPRGFPLGWRYVRVTDTNGRNFTGSNTGKANDHAFNVVLKPQNQKYDVKDLTGSQRITVNDIDNITEDELGTIKSRLQLEYSKTNTDARLQNLAGTDVSNSSQLIKAVVVSPTDSTKLAVTYNDGSVDTIEKNKVLNVRPKGIIPFSNSAQKEIYVYKGEETNLKFGVTDDSGKIKDLRIVQAKGVVGASGAAQGQVVNQYGLTMTSQTDTDGINATEDNPAITRITGTVNVPGKPQYVGTLMTRYLVAEDLERAVFSPPLQNSSLEQEGAFKLVVREQTQKYDIVSQTNEADKIVVSDPDNLSEADLTKIKENIKVKYSTADDARLSDKNNTEVENASNYIKSVTQQGDQLVVTYNDGSTDSVPLTSVVKLDKQPAIDAVNTAAEEQINAINGNAEATQEEKDAAIAKVNADKEKALAAINDPNLTTKAALNQAQTEGTTAIAADNPVVAKKAEAKAAIEAARKAKEDAINADRNLSEAEKTAAIAKANEAARAATEKIDAATTDAAVDEAQTEATTAISKVNPIAKENAKAAVANALTAKNDEIDKRTDLSQAEKDAAKAEAQKLADAELAKINAQPDNEDTEDAARATQKLVDAAEDKGVADVTSVTPVAKAAAKKAVADELAKKEAEIDARQDLTAEEKDAAKKEAQAKAAEANKAIDAQPEVAATPEEAQAAQEQVDAAKEKGVEAIKAVNPETTAKAAADKAIDDALAAKNKAIDERTDLTD
uniref:DUF1542 domain-containing protein n=1 Tax=Streptococcus pseudopneumoniae TaxID=257758 RepID=UPI0039F041A8